MGRGADRNNRPQAIPETEATNGRATPRKTPPAESATMSTRPANRPLPYASFESKLTPKEPDAAQPLPQPVDPITRITECPLGIEGHGSSLCPLHRGLDNAMAAVEMAFRKMTIHQVLSQPSGSRPLCPFPPRVEKTPG